MAKHSRIRKNIFHLPLLLLCLTGYPAAAQQQDATVTARLDAGRITVGDRARLFIEVQHNSARSKLVWAALPDTFNSLEIVQKGPVDTLRKQDTVIYRQQLQITGFDSGNFVIPSFLFSVIPSDGTAYTLQTESFSLEVTTVAVDTTKGYKGIKEIIYVQSSWLDYIWWITGGALGAALLALVLYYFSRRKKTTPPEPLPVYPPETLRDRYLRLLGELDGQQLWQQNRVKEYYVALTDILRDYIEERFHTPAMEQTTDELLDKARIHADMRIHLFLLEQILRTADLAKFAKAQPLPQEHAAAMEATRKFITATQPVSPETTPKQ